MGAIPEDSGALHRGAMQRHYNTSFQCLSWLHLDLQSRSGRSQLEQIKSHLPLRNPSSVSTSGGPAAPRPPGSFLMSQAGPTTLGTAAVIWVKLNRGAEGIGSRRVQVTALSWVL